MTQDQFWHWQARLSGEDLGCEDGKPMPGFYRSRNEPVAIWRDETSGTLVARIGARTITDDLRIAELWGFCHAQPVTYEEYEAVAEHGAPWPDQHPAARTSPLASDIHAEAERLSAEAQILISAGAAGDENAAARAAELADALSDIEKRADAERRAAKKPHEEAAKVVDQHWRPTIDRAADAKRDLKRAVIEPWLKKKAAADQKARASAAIEIGAAVPQEPAKAATRGGRVALRTYRATTVEDARAALRWFADRNEDVPGALIEIIQKLAKGFSEVGVVVPGTTTITEQRAA